MKSYINEMLSDFKAVFKKTVKRDPLKLDSYHLKQKHNICQVQYSKGSYMDHIEEYSGIPAGIYNNKLSRVGHLKTEPQPCKKKWDT